MYDCDVTNVEEKCDANGPAGIPAIGGTHLLGIRFAPRIVQHRKSLAVAPAARRKAAIKEGQAQLI
jgi:hypothetical protein